MMEERVRQASGTPSARGASWIVYWMQQARREACNHALEYALARARDMGLPAFVLFCVDPSYPGAGPSHYRFMLEGLEETAGDLAARGIRLLVRIGDPVEELVAACGRAALAVTDGGHTPVQRRWRAEAAARCPCPLYVVETDTAVPPDMLHDRRAWSAAVLRRRMEPLLEGMLEPPRRREVAIPGFLPDMPAMSPLEALALLPEHPPAGRAGRIRPGPAAARAALGRFIDEDLDEYGSSSRDPARNCVSGLSPYLHFGQISPVEAALEIRKTGSQGACAFLEQLLVRRELAVNFCARAPAPGSWGAIPEWARRTLDEHSGDQREYAYALEELEGARTHDDAWNAAQKELVTTGCMHGYMRMYWGKMILAWTPSPEEAFRRATLLNDRYALDGRDPNSMAGIGWCFGLHDRPWPGRRVFGSVRSMTRRSLDAKYDIGAYVARVESIAGEDMR